MTIPSLVAAGTGNTGSPSWPPGYSVGDFGLVCVVNRDAPIATPTGYNHALKQIGIGGSTTINVLLDLFWRFATTTSEAAPSITGSTGVMWSTVMVYTGVNSANPFQVSSVDYMASNVVFPGTQTQLPDCLVLDIAGVASTTLGTLISSFTNDGNTLASQAVRFDAGTNQGRGAHLCVLDGQKATPGICGITRPTTINASAMVKLALQSATQSLGHKSRAVNTGM